MGLISKQLEKIHGTLLGTLFLFMTKGASLICITMEKSETTVTEEWVDLAEMALIDSFDEKKD